MSIVSGACALSLSLPDKSCIAPGSSVRPPTRDFRSPLSGSVLDNRATSTQLAHKVGPKWGRAGIYMCMWGPCLSHIAHMGPIRFLLGVMWGT